MNTFSLPALISKDQESLMLFILGNDLKIHFNSLDQNNQWLSTGNQWNKLDYFSEYPEFALDSFPVGVPITASYCLNSSAKDLFGTKENGSIYHLRLGKVRRGYTSTARWARIGSNFPTGAPITALSRIEKLTEIFAINNEGRVYSNNCTLDRGWSSTWNNLGGAFPAGAPVTAISRDQISWDLFAVGNDGRVYWHNWEPAYNTLGHLIPSSGPAQWVPLPGTTFTPGAHISAIARSFERMEIFVAGPDQQIHYNSWSKNSGWLTDTGGEILIFNIFGDKDKWIELGGNFPDGCPVQAISCQPGAIDLFATGIDGFVHRKRHVDGEEWPLAWDNFGAKCFLMGAPISGISRRPDLIELLTQSRDEIVYYGKISEDGTWSDWQPLGVPYRDERMFGFAELHSHPASHLAFGANEHGDDGIFWGKPGMALENAAQTLPNDLASCNGDTHVHGTEFLDFPKHESRKKIIGGINSINGFSHGKNGWPYFLHWPHSQSLLHQQIHISFIHRAYLGGLRLMLASVTENQVLSKLWHKEVGPEAEADYDYNSARHQFSFIHQLAQANQQWMRIVTTPQEARQAIAENCLAVVLSLELDQLTLEQVEILYNEFGVRQIIPIHLINNSFGGVAIYADLFNTSNWYVNGKFLEVTEDRNLSFRLQKPDYIKRTVDDVLAGGLALPEPIPEPEYKWLGYDCNADFPIHNCARHHGHKNPVGLSKSRILRLMKMGMLIDLAHMSENSMEDSLDLGKTIRYPFMNSHTGIRPDTGDGGSERGMKNSHTQNMAKLGGVLGLGTEGGVHYSNTITLCLFELEEKQSLILNEENRELSLNVNVTISHDPNLQVQYLSAIIHTLKGDGFLDKEKGDGVRSGSYVFIKINFRNNIFPQYRVDINFGSEWQANSDLKALIRLPHPTTIANLDSIVLELVGTGDDFTYDKWEVNRFQVSAVFDNPLAAWASGYAHSLATMDNYGVAVGTDFNGYAPQIPFATSPQINYPLQAANTLAPRGIANNFPPLNEHQISEFKTFNINLDGIAHFGLLPDFAQGLFDIFTESGSRTPGLEITQFYKTAEATIQMWERSIAASRRINDALINQIQGEEVSDARLHIIIKTGGDNLKGDNDNAHALIGLKNGRRLNVFLNQRNEWHDGSTNVVTIDLPNKTQAADISFIGIKTTLGGGAFPDNWNMEQIILEYEGNERNQILLRQENTPLKRFSGDDQFWWAFLGATFTDVVGFHAEGSQYWSAFTYSYEDEKKNSQIIRLAITITTGKDPLPGDNDNAFLEVDFTNGRNIRFPLNGIIEWTSYTTHYIVLDLPPKVKRRDILAMRIITTLSAGGLWGIGRKEWYIHRLIVSWQGCGQFGNFFHDEGAPLIHLTPENRSFEIPIYLYQELRLFNNYTPSNNALNPSFSTLLINYLEEPTEPPFKSCVSIQSAYGFYWTAENGGGSKISANSDQISLFETFLFEYQGSNFVALKTVEGYYVSADNGGGLQILADKRKVGHQECFEVIYLGLKKCALRTHNGQYIRANANGELWATNLTIGAEEVFNINSLNIDDTYIQVNNFYLRFPQPSLGSVPISLQNQILLADSSTQDSVENRFRIIFYRNNIVVVQQEGLFWTLDPISNEIKANKKNISTLSLFEWVELPHNKFALLGANGFYLSAENGGGGRVLSNALSIGLWETFNTDLLSINPLLGTLVNSVNIPYSYAGSIIPPGTDLLPGQYLRSPSGIHTLIYQPDGNLALYEFGHQLWSSQTGGINPGKVKLSENGDLVIYNQENKAVWSIASKITGGQLSLQNNGNLTISGSSDKTTWSTLTGNGQVIRDALLPRESLLPGQSLYSNNRMFKLHYHPDGDLVFSNALNNKVIWNLETQGIEPGRLLLEANGNLKLFSGSGMPAWSTFLPDLVQKDAQLTLKDEGIVALTSSSQPILNNLVDVPSIRTGTSGIFAYKHVTAAENINQQLSFLNHPLTNDTADCYVFPARTWGHQNFGTSNPNTIGVQYTGNRWAIANQNPAKAMSPNDSFHVLIVPAHHPNAFVHTAQEKNTRENRTYLDHPLLNERPNAYLLVTQRGAVNNNHELCVRYDTERNQWYIFNKVIDAGAQADPANQMPLGAQFNVLGLQGDELGDIAAFSHQVGPDNFIPPVTSAIDHPSLNYHPGAMAFFTECWRQDFLSSPNGIEGAFNIGVAELWYDHPEDAYKEGYRNNYWMFYNANSVHMIQGQGFNIFVWTTLTGRKL